MREVASFQVFLRDRKPRMNALYPFLSQDQIMCKLREQWKQLDESRRQLFCKLISKKGNARSVKKMTRPRSRSRNPSSIAHRSNSGGNRNYQIFEEDNLNFCEYDFDAPKPMGDLENSNVKELGQNISQKASNIHDKATSKSKSRRRSRSRSKSRSRSRSLKKTEKTYSGRAFTLKQQVPEVQSKCQEVCTGILKKQCKTPKPVSNHVSFSPYEVTAYGDGVRYRNINGTDEEMENLQIKQEDTMTVMKSVVDVTGGIEHTIMVEIKKVLEKNEPKDLNSVKPASKKDEQNENSSKQGTSITCAASRATVKYSSNQRQTSPSKNVSQRNQFNGPNISKKVGGDSLQNCRREAIENKDSSVNENQSMAYGRQIEKCLSRKAGTLPKYKKFGKKSKVGTSVKQGVENDDTAINTGVRGKEVGKQDTLLAKSLRMTPSRQMRLKFLSLSPETITDLSRKEPSCSYQKRPPPIGSEVVEQAVKDACSQKPDGKFPPAEAKHSTDQHTELHKPVHVKKTNSFLTALVSDGIQSTLVSSGLNTCTADHKNDDLYRLDEEDNEDDAVLLHRPDNNSEQDTNANKRGSQDDCLVRDNISDGHQKGIRQSSKKRAVKRNKNRKNKGRRKKSPIRITKVTCEDAGKVIVDDAAASSQTSEPGNSKMVRVKIMLKQIKPKKTKRRRTSPKQYMNGDIGRRSSTRRKRRKNSSKSPCRNLKVVKVTQHPELKLSEQRYTTTKSQNSENKISANTQKVSNIAKKTSAELVLPILKTIADVKKNKLKFKRSPSKIPSKQNTPVDNMSNSKHVEVISIKQMGQKVKNYRRGKDKDYTTTNLNIGNANWNNNYGDAYGNFETDFETGFECGSSEDDTAHCTSDVYFDEDSEDDNDVFCTDMASQTTSTLLQALMRLKSVSPLRALSTECTSPSVQSSFHGSIVDDQQICTQASGSIMDVNDNSPQQGVKKRRSDAFGLKSLSQDDFTASKSVIKQKEEVNRMFQDIPTQPVRNYATPAKRRLLASAAQQTPGNFTCMFEESDCFC